MSQYNDLEAAAHANTVTPALIAGAVSEVAEGLRAKAATASHPGLFDTEIGQLGVIAAAASTLTPAQPSESPERKKK